MNKSKSTFKAFQTGAVATLILGNATFAFAVNAREKQNRTGQPSATVSNTPAITAQDQGQTVSDVEITQKIRQRLNEDKDLSMKAKNILIVTRENTVHLRGPVATDSECDRVASIAKQVAANMTVINETTAAR